MSKKLSCFCFDLRVPIDEYGFLTCIARRISRHCQLTFQALDANNEGLVSSFKLISELASCGLHIDKDSRLAETYAKLQNLNAVHQDVHMDLELFANVTHENISLISKAISGKSIWWRSKIFSSDRVML